MIMELTEEEKNEFTEAENPFVVPGYVGKSKGSRMHIFLRGRWRVVPSISIGVVGSAFLCFPNGYTHTHTESIIVSLTHIARVCVLQVIYDLLFFR